jgi:LCP family protein required for cell wall assembly
MKSSALKKRSAWSPVLVASAVGLAGGLALAGPLSGLLKGDLLDKAHSLTNPFAAWTGLGDQEMVVLGTDVGGGNTDVMYLVKVANGVTRLTQVPRDTYIESSVYGPLKVNALYSFGGVKAVKQELSSRMGEPIDHHIVVDLSAVRRIGDQLGGLEVNVPKRMYYVDRSQGLYIDLQPGPQTLKGRDLEGFIRYRHDELGDIGRLERQKLVLNALFAKLTRPENLLRLPSLIGSVGKDLKTDLGPMELGGLATAMATTRLETKRLGGRPFDRNGISYWETEWPKPPAASDSTADSSNRYRFLF